MSLPMIDGVSSIRMSISLARSTGSFPGDDQRRSLDERSNGHGWIPADGDRQNGAIQDVEFRAAKHFAAVIDDAVVRRLADLAAAQGVNRHQRTQPRPVKGNLQAPASRLRQ